MKRFLIVVLVAVLQVSSVWAGPGDSGGGGKGPGGGGRPVSFIGPGEEGGLTTSLYSSEDLKCYIQVHTGELFPLNSVGEPSDELELIEAPECLQLERSDLTDI